MTKRHIYLVKKICPWMIEEISYMARYADFTLLLLRKPSQDYLSSLSKIREQGVEIAVNPKSVKDSGYRILLVLMYLMKHISKLYPLHNAVIALDAAWMFIRLDPKWLSSPLSIHAQFATQASIVADLIKSYKKRNAEFFFTFHAYDIYFRNKWFSYLLNRAVKAFSISEYNITYIADNYRGADTSKIVLSRLGAAPVDHPGQRSFGRDGRMVFGTLSWLVEKKGIQYLLPAVMELRKKQRKCKFVIAGDGPFKEYIVSFIKDNQLEDWVEYIGKVFGDDKEKFYSGIDVFILPCINTGSDMDGIPVVLMEAVARGIPIISTNISGIPEICVDMDNGLLIQEKSVTEIVASVEHILDHPEQLPAFSSSSIRISQMYNIDANTQKKAQVLSWLSKDGDGE